MKVTVELEQEDYNVLHDLVFDIFGIKLDNVGLKNVWDMLPEHIKGNAMQWGLDDSVVRDDIHVLLQNERDIVKIDSHNEDES